VKIFVVQRGTIIEPGAFGMMMDERGWPFAVTLERTYENLRVKVPAGAYTCPRTKYLKGGYPTFEIPVPGHTRILLHVANVETELEGCIAVALKFGELKGRLAVLESRAGFERFMARAGDDDAIRLVVRDPRP
jgi:hypothetical protein